MTSARLLQAVHEAPDSGDPAPVAAQFVVTFLKPEMLHIYRQITALRAFRPIVFCQKRENSGLFPIGDLVLFPKPRTHQLRRLVQRQLLHRPITIYQSEAKAIAAELRRTGARLLHIYFGHIGVFLLPLFNLCEVPVIVSFHGADAQIDLHKQAYLDRTREMLAKAQLLLVRSESLAARLIAIGADRRKIRIHRTGIPLAAIPFVPRHAPTDGVWHGLQACRLIEKKGLATTLRAFAEFAKAHPRARLTIAGEGPQLPELQALAGSLGLADRVIFSGFVSQEKLRNLFAEAHFFLHPSELAADGNQEGVPNSMLEAMASGLPVLATHHGGIPEAVEHGVSGLLTPERDAHALAESMHQLAGDPSLYLAMSVAARQRVERDFALEAQVRVLEGYYFEALAAAS